MKKFIKDRENQIIGILSLLTIIVAISPLISRYCINGHDLEYHLLRIEALKEDILIGRPFLKVDTLFFGGAGYASSMFYSNFLLYIPAIMRALGVSIKTSYHSYAAICVILCYASAFYCTMRMTKSKYAGLISGMLLTLCPYHMDDVLVRAAAGEYMAFIFVPFVLYGIYNVLYEDMDKPYILGIGFGGVILSHTATLVMCIIFCVCACVIKIKSFIKNPKILLRLMITAAVTAVVTSIYWLPMLEQLLSSGFSVTDGGSSDMMYAAVSFSEVLSQAFPTMGIALLIFAVPRVFIKKNGDRLLEFADWMVIGGIAFALLTTELMPWTRLSRIFSFVQFPWRFFLMSSVLFALADGIIIYRVLSDMITALSAKSDAQAIIKKISVFTVFAVMSFTALVHQTENAEDYYSYSDDYYSYKPFTGAVIGGEWLPEAVEDRERLVAQSDEMVADNGQMLDFTRNRGRVIATVASDYEYIDVPFLYYKGYTAVITENGTSTVLNIDGHGDNGLCRVYTEGKCGELTVYYKGTTLQYISYILTVAGLIAVAAYYLIISRKNKKAGIIS